MEYPGLVVVVNACQPLFRSWLLSCSITKNIKWLLEPYSSSHFICIVFDFFELRACYFGFAGHIKR